MKHTEPPYTYPTDVVEGGEQHTMPEGYRKVSVIFTEQEYKAINGMAVIADDGTASEAVRVWMGLPREARGFAKAWKEHLARR